MGIFYSSLCSVVFALSLHVSMCHARVYSRSGLVLHLRPSNDTALFHLHAADYAALTDVLLRGKSD